jgi:hypothetical protein
VSRVSGYAGSASPAERRRQIGRIEGRERRVDENEIRCWSGLFLLPDQNVGLFISTNGTSGGQVVSAVARAFMDRYYPVADAPVAPVPADFGERAALYAGDYYLARSSFTTLEKFISRRGRGGPEPLGARLARWAASLFGLVYVVFIAALGIGFGTIDPAYGVPGVYFGIPAWMQAASYLPWLAALLGAAMAIFTVLAWRRGYWNRRGRAAYSGVAVYALAMVWSLAYWNLL